jgi:hypothetical protein
MLIVDERDDNEDNSKMDICMIGEVGNNKLLLMDERDDT